jgi:hypothetical protein
MIALGMKKRCHGIKISFYNENNIDEDTYFVVCNEEWFDITKEEIVKFLKKDNNILKRNIICRILKDL